MEAESIFYPMGVLLAITAVVTATIASTRIGSVLRGRVSEDFFRMFEGEPRREFEARLSRHYLNLLEQPVLLYVAGLGIFVSQRVDSTFVTLFWVYVGLRAVHTGIHLSYNRPAHRAAVFIASFVVLMVVWARFFWLLGSGAGA